MTLPDKNLNWPVTYEAVLEIARSEGLRLKAYRCPAGVPTLARGRTRGVKMGDTCTQGQADAWFVEDLTEFTDGVRRVLKRDASENELGEVFQQPLVGLFLRAGVARLDAIRPSPRDS